ncbi:excinuclease ABC subunit B [Roseivivax marinus]|uniref:excinuclease ABC subunit B n=1 Tax=Roseivivax marinus TaxID=1379903 RepID=UPI00273ED0BC|nr:excinuclease ABC subunit B [Roseivivax marinus]
MRALPILGLLLLAACATPLERCVSQARSSLTAAETELRDLERTIARGYAIEYRVRTYPVYTTCRGYKGTIHPCWRDRVQRVPRRVNVNMDEVRRRAADLRARIPALSASADRGAEQCRATYAQIAAQEG